MGYTFLRQYPWEVAFPLATVDASNTISAGLAQAGNTTTIDDPT